MTLAALATFALSSRAAAANQATYVVAARDLPIGARITAADLALVRLSLEGSVAANAFVDRPALVGSTTLGPVREGELLQSGTINKAAANSKPEMSFALPASRAIGGDLRSGETIDVLVTRKNSDALVADVAVSDATVVKVSGGNAGVGRSGDVTITVALKDRTEAAVLAAALDGASVTLQRTTGVPATASKP